MKRILIIGSTQSGSKNEPSVIYSHLIKNNVDVKLCYWEDIVFDIKTGEVNVTVSGEDIVRDINPQEVLAFNWYKSGKNSYYRDIAFAFSLYLEDAGIPFWNSEMRMQRSTTKLSCMVQLALNGVPVPDSMFSLHGSYDFPDLPFIVKSIAASRGDSNHLVEDNSIALKHLSSDIPYMAQPFLHNDHDLRVVCFGGNPAMVLRRSRDIGSDTHMNNTSQGGSAVWIDISELDGKLLTLCRKICIILGREMGGIDLIPDSSSPYGYSCLEVNAIPQLTSGFDVDKKLDELAKAVYEIESERK